MPKGVPYFFMEIFCLCATVCPSHYHMSHAYSNGPHKLLSYERSHQGKLPKGHTAQGTQDTEKRESREFYFPALPDLSNGPRKI